MKTSEKAVEFKKRKNCCQAVLLAFAEKLPLDENTLLQIGSGFGSGMGGMEATCGALCGACIAAGLMNDTQKPTKMLARNILNDFQTACGATLCKDLKGVSTGKMLCSCDDCVRNAVLALERAFGMEAFNS